MLRPVVAAAVIIPLFAARPSANGSSMAVELAGVAAGLLGGLAAAVLMSVYRSPKTGKPVSRAAAPYANFWAVVIAARAAFSYGAAHWFSAQIAGWAVANHVTEASIVDELIFAAIVMILVRTTWLSGRASRLPTRGPGLAKCLVTPSLRLQGRHPGCTDGIRAGRNHPSDAPRIITTSIRATCSPVLAAGDRDGIAKLGRRFWHGYLGIHRTTPDADGRLR